MGINLNEHCRGHWDQDPVFQDLLSAWGVDLKDWKQCKPKASGASPASSPGEVGPAPAPSPSASSASSKDRVLGLIKGPHVSCKPQ